MDVYFYVWCFEIFNRICQRASKLYFRNADGPIVQPGYDNNWRLFFMEETEYVGECKACGYIGKFKYIGEQTLPNLKEYKNKRMYLFNCPKCEATVSKLISI